MVGERREKLGVERQAYINMKGGENVSVWVNEMVEGYIIEECEMQCKHTRTVHLSNQTYKPFCTQTRLHKANVFA